jgi:hypothetical protein
VDSYSSAVLCFAPDIATAFHQEPDDTGYYQRFHPGYERLPPRW